LIKEGYKVQVMEYYPDFELDSEGKPVNKSQNPVRPVFIFKILYPDNSKGEIYMGFVRMVDSEDYREDEINQHTRYAVRTSLENVEIN
jgi:hypothetical protein